MRQVCAMLAFEWRFEPANAFALLRERCPDIDGMRRPVPSAGCDKLPMRHALEVR
jgi:hypothetical protein